MAPIGKWFGVFLLIFLAAALAVAAQTECQCSPLSFSLLIENPGDFTDNFIFTSDHPRATITPPTAVIAAGKSAQVTVTIELGCTDSRSEISFSSSSTITGKSQKSTIRYDPQGYCHLVAVSDDKIDPLPIDISRPEILALLGLPFLLIFLAVIATLAKSMPKLPSLPIGKKTKEYPWESRFELGPEPIEPIKVEPIRETPKPATKELKEEPFYEGPADEPGEPLKLPTLPSIRISKKFVVAVVIVAVLILLGIGGSKVYPAVIGPNGTFSNFTMPDFKFWGGNETVVEEPGPEENKTIGRRGLDRDFVFVNESLKGEPSNQEDIEMDEPGESGKDRSALAAVSAAILFVIVLLAFIWIITAQEKTRKWKMILGIITAGIDIAVIAFLAWLAFIKFDTLSGAWIAIRDFISKYFFFIIFGFVILAIIIAVLSAFKKDKGEDKIKIPEKEKSTKKAAKKKSPMKKRK